MSLVYGCETHIKRKTKNTNTKFLCYNLRKEDVASSLFELQQQQKLNKEIWYSAFCICNKTKLKKTNKR